MTAPAVVARGDRGDIGSSRRLRQHQGAGTVLLVAAAVVGTPVGLAWSFETFTYDVWGAFVWGPVLLLVCLPLTRWVSRRTGEPEIVRFLMGAALLKIVVGSLVRYGTAEAFYGGVADAAAYDNAGGLLVPQLRNFDFSDLGALSGTRFIEVLTGAVQAVVGQTRLGTFLVFSFFGFVGMLLLYVAFCEVVPDGNRRRYRLLLMLAPSVWYWPSSIGKEAFMLLCLGAAAYGSARLLRGHLLGLVPAGLGLWGTLVVRPHLTLAFFAGLLLAAPTLGPSHGRRRTLSAVAVPLLALVALPLVVGRVEAFFNIDQLDADSAESVLERVSDRTAKGGSEVELVGGGSFTPAGLATGAVTVFVRPYPWEAEGARGLASSLEAVGVAGFAVYVLLRHAGGVAAWFRERYVRLVLGYCAAFAVAFSAVANLGILARQRSLLYPFLFVAVCLPRRTPAARS